jgi:phage N-6-adenine-methyltransferase
VNNALMFGKATDEWETPQVLFDALNKEFTFTVDAAATAANAKVGQYLGSGALFTDAMDPALHWGNSGVVWLNPPYSRCREFIAKAASEAREWRCTVVCLVPARTDTRWWHESVWDAENHRPRPGVEIRFIKGRLKFAGATAGAPFPSVVIVFRPIQESQ